jgi:hypothetical protein
MPDLDKASQRQRTDVYAVRNSFVINILSVTAVLSILYTEKGLPIRP